MLVIQIAARTLASDSVTTVACDFAHLQGESLESMGIFDEQRLRGGAPK